MNSVQSSSTRQNVTQVASESEAVRVNMDEPLTFPFGAQEPPRHFTHRSALDYKMLAQ